MKIVEYYTPELGLKDVLLYPLPELTDAEGFLQAKGHQYFYLDSNKLLIRDFKKKNLAEIPLKDFRLDKGDIVFLVK